MDEAYPATAICWVFHDSCISWPELVQIIMKGTEEVYNSYGGGEIHL